jgi:hypothetical protein
MLKRRDGREAMEEKRWNRREEMEEKRCVNMSLVSVAIAENRVVSVSSTTRTRQHQLSIQ